MFIKSTMALVAALVLAGSLGAVLVAQTRSQIENGTPAEVYSQFYGPSEVPVDLPRYLHPKAKASR